jgi:dTMP kinase
MLIVIEGIDGSGKGTQTVRLQEALAASGKDVRLYSFPRYAETQGGELVGRYLRSEFGDAHPALAALPFLLDRLESLEELQSQLNVRDVVICDRYVPSNIAHQAARLPPDEVLKFMLWLFKLEHETFHVPKPDLVIGLDLPVQLASRLIAKKNPRVYTTEKEDRHEADKEYLSGVRRCYRQVATLYRDWVTVSVSRNGHIRPIDDVAADIWNVCQECLQARAHTHKKV